MGVVENVCGPLHAQEFGCTTIMGNIDMRGAYPCRHSPSVIWMNTYLLKPVELKNLEQCIKLWIS